MARKTKCTYDDIMASGSGFTIDKSKLLTGKLQISDYMKNGYAVRYKKGRFVGLLDEGKEIIWYVVEKTLTEV